MKRQATQMEWHNEGCVNWMRETGVPSLSQTWGELACEHLVAEPGLMGPSWAHHEVAALWGIVIGV